MKTTYSITFLLVVLCTPSIRAQTHEWTRQLSTSVGEKSWSVSADGLGSVYIAGRTVGTLGETSFGSFDAFVSKYDDSGTLEWTQQLGTGDRDWANAVSADGLGNVYIAGATLGGLEGHNAGEWDAFISKYDASGTLEWTRQLGTSGGDGSSAVSADGLGNVFITGWTMGELEGTNAGEWDAFIRKYDAQGMLHWTRQLGTADGDDASGVSADGLGNVYISGRTGGTLAGSNAGDFDAYLTKYDDTGERHWIRQFGTSDYDASGGVSADGLGNVYITGSIASRLVNFNRTWADAYLRKYDDSGELQWTRELATSAWEESRSVSADGLGNVYISGLFDDEGSNFANVDAFVSKYDDSGELQWTQRLGTSEWDESYGVSADGLGNVYISGSTEGGLEGPNAGNWDAFVAKYTNDLPEPVVDFDGDGEVDGDDVDALIGEIVAGTNDATFDLTADGTVNNADLSQWLSDAATQNGFNAPYLLGDANLDGSVDTADLNNLALSWLQDVALWSAGDFTADGIVNSADLNGLALNWRESIPSAAWSESVPEPSGMALLYVTAVLAALTRYKNWERVRHTRRTRNY